MPSAPKPVSPHNSPHWFTQSKSKATHVQVSKPTGETHIPKAKSYENSEPPGVLE